MVATTTNPIAVIYFINCPWTTLFTLKVHDLPICQSCCTMIVAPCIFHMSFIAHNRPRFGSQITICIPADELDHGGMMNLSGNFVSFVYCNLVKAYYS